jgi:undecaprenyl-diphosphatase
MPVFLQAVLLGVIQGITEFLPVSSTAHLLLGGRLIGHDDPGGVFTVLIQFGSILALVWLYRAKLMDLAAGLPSRPEARRFALAIAAATVPALVAGALLAPFVKNVLYETPGVFAGAFIVGGIVMLFAERLCPVPVVQEATHTPFARAVGIGCCQVLALVPGVSRSGATIIGALLLGLDRAAAAEFSFFLAIPTMAAAFAHDLIDVRPHLSTDRALEMAIGLMSAFIASVLVVGPFLNFVRRSGFVGFAWYRILLGVALLVAIAAGWMNT